LRAIWPDYCGSANESRAPNCFVRRIGTIAVIAALSERTVIDARKKEMPFEKTLCQPELIEAMHAAFIRICRILRLRPGSSESDVVALSVLDLAKTGVHDARTLASLALSALNRATD
jgi:hypothetical protein